MPINPIIPETELAIQNCAANTRHRVWGYIRAEELVRRALEAKRPVVLPPEALDQAQPLAWWQRLLGKKAPYQSPLPENFTEGTVVAGALAGESTLDAEARLWARRPEGTPVRHGKDITGNLLYAVWMPQTKEGTPTSVTGDPEF